MNHGECHGLSGEEKASIEIAIFQARVRITPPLNALWTKIAHVSKLAQLLHLSYSVLLVAELYISRQI